MASICSVLKPKLSNIANVVWANKGSLWSVRSCSRGASETKSGLIDTVIPSGLLLTLNAVSCSVLNTTPESSLTDSTAFCCSLVKLSNVLLFTWFTCSVIVPVESTR